mmetsp:Transcript_10420/g.14541  ORF Transcript_10420/g.14541 Transcript_10420/m.14541 type:complete len:88 (-) Transcript_10420:1195-1458(-)
MASSKLAREAEEEHPLLPLLAACIDEDDGDDRSLANVCLRSSVGRFFLSASSLRRFLLLFALGKPDAIMNQKATVKDASDSTMLAAI